LGERRACSSYYIEVFDNFLYISYNLAFEGQVFEKLKVSLALASIGQMRLNNPPKEALMPIMASQGRSDARGTAQLLASMALDCIANPGVACEQEVALNNVYRLLESYRKNPSFGHELPAHQTGQSAAQRLGLRRPIERHVKEVRDALEHAKTAAFGEITKDVAMQTVETVLRSVAYPDKDQGGTTPEDQARTATFFKKLVERLQVD
jgi:hypothetical protein